MSAAPGDVERVARQILIENGASWAKSDKLWDEAKKSEAGHELCDVVDLAMAGAKMAIRLSEATRDAAVSICRADKGMRVHPGCIASGDGYLAAEQLERWIADMALPLTTEPAP